MKTTLRLIDYILAITLLCSACQTDPGYKKSIYRIEQELHYTDSIPNFQFTSDGPIEIVLPKKKISFIPSEVIELDHYVPLETNDSCLFGDVEKMMIKENLIFIMDGSQKMIMIFDQTGKFKAKIDHTGNGPGEYFHIKDFDVQKGLIHILDDIKAKMLTYTFDGEWVNTKKMAIAFLNFCILPDNSFFLSAAGQRNEFIPELQDYSYLLGFPDSLITHKGFLRTEAGNKMSKVRYADNISKYFDTILFIPQYHQSVYQVTAAKTIRELYRVLFEKPITEEALEDANPNIYNRDLVSEGYQYLAHAWLETPEYSFFQYPYPNERSGISNTSCFYSKAKQTVLAFESWNDFDPAYLYFLTPITTHQDLFVSVLPPNRIIENKSRILEKNANNPEVFRILHQLKEEDNPVLMFFRIKENNPFF